MLQNAADSDLKSWFGNDNDERYMVAPKQQPQPISYPQNNQFAQQVPNTSQTWQSGPSYSSYLNNSSQHQLANSQSKPQASSTPVKPKRWFRDASGNFQWIPILVALSLVVGLGMFLYTIMNLRQEKKKRQRHYNDVLQEFDEVAPTLEQVRQLTCPVIPADVTKAMSYEDLPTLPGSVYGKMLSEMGRRIDNNFTIATEDGNGQTIDERISLIKSCQEMLNAMELLALGATIKFACGFDCTDMKIRLNSALEQISSKA